MLKRIFAPQVNVNDTEATIIAWNVASGDLVTSAQTITVLETNKAAQDIEAEADGYLYYRRQLNSAIVVGELLAVVNDVPLTDGELDEIFNPIAIVESEILAGILPANVADVESNEYSVTAKAKKIIEKNGLKFEDFPRGTKITADIVNALLATRAGVPTSEVTKQQSKPAPSNLEAITEHPEQAPGNKVPDYFIELKTSATKQQEVAALVASYHQLVPSEVTVAVDSTWFASKVTLLTALHSFPFTLGDLVLHGCSQLLAKYPELNGFFHEGRAYKQEGVNVGYALNFGKGLRVPVIRDADKKDLLDVVQELRGYILKYSQDELQNRDCSRGSFTITDLSASDVLTFRPVVSPMQSAILGIGRDTDSEQIRLILGFDHRMADGLLAAQFLNELKAFLEERTKKKSVKVNPNISTVDIAPAKDNNSEVPRELKRSELKNLLLQYKERKLTYAEFRRSANALDQIFAVYPLSEVQKGFWVMQKLAPAISAYNIPICFRWRGELNVTRFQQATNYLLKQHPILTSTVREENGVLLQAMQPIHVPVQTESIAGIGQKAVLDRLKLLNKRPFELDHGPLIRVQVLSRNADDQIVLISIHHIISDGHSCEMLVRALVNNYQTLSSGNQPALDVSAVHYGAFVEWERQWLANPSLVDEQWNYWCRQLAGPLPECNLPVDRPRTAVVNFNGESFVSILKSGVCKQIGVYAKRNGLKQSVVYLGLFKVLLSYLTDQKDLIVGMPISGRPQERFATTLGCFINMIAVRSSLSMQQSVLAFFKQLQLTITSALYHGNLPFSLLVKKLELSRTPRYSPIFQIAYIYHELQASQLVDSDSPEIVEGLTQEGQYELTLEIQEKKDVPIISWKYDSDLFDAKSIKRIADLYAILAEELDANGSLSLTEYLRVAGADEFLLAADQTTTVDHAITRDLRFDGKEVSANTSFTQEQCRKIGGDRARGVDTFAVASPTYLEVEDNGSLVNTDEIGAVVLRIWKSVLGFDSLAMDIGFFQAGGKSVTSVLLVDKISKEFACNFTITLLFKYPTVKAIASYLSKLLATNKQVETKRHALEFNSQVSDVRNHASEIKYQASEVKTKTVRDELAHAAAHDAQKRVELPDYYKDSVAIIGISCEFPGARNYHEFWENLVNGVESAQFFSKQELRTRGVAEELIKNRNYVPVASSIAGKDLFDAQFFDLSVRNAELMDPQLRLLLMHSWRALEDAGYVAADIPDTAVVMTANNASYNASLHNGAAPDPDPLLNYLMAQGGTIPTSISYYLGLKGPSVFIHTNCSSSLVALHSAYQGLRLGDSKCALVGGASIYSLENVGYVHQPGLNFSSDGHCRAFDSQADGMTIGEGVGVILIKTALDAARDGDHIYAILRGIGINNDGADKAGFYAPSVTGQSALIAKVLNASEIHPESIDFVEAHGTGTKLGDPIEVMALSNAYQKYTNKKQFCALSAVKPNIGHLDSASGIAGVIKVALCLQHGQIPPSINFQKPNPEINFTDSPFFISAELTQLAKKSQPNRAALSSFGIGGTNAHAIFEAYDICDIGAANRLQNNRAEHFIVPLSAKHEDTLREYAVQLHEQIKSNPRTSISALAYTLQVGRVAFLHRVAFVVRNLDELIASLVQFIDDSDSTVDQRFFRSTKGIKQRQAATIEASEDNNELIQHWIKQGAQRKLATCWVMGAGVDWKLLYPEGFPSKISLPTYPFSLQQYWIQAPELKNSQGVALKPATSVILHPLLHRNTSNFNAQRFSSTFSSDEFLLNDHVIHGRCIFPGECYLEMARTAVLRSAGLESGSSAQIAMKDVVWMRPLIVENTEEVHISLVSQDGRDTAFEIYTSQRDERGNEENNVHARGRAILLEAATDDAFASIDLALLRTLSSYSIKKEACYSAFTAAGLGYGPAHRGLTEVRIGKDNRGQGFVLAEVTLPTCVSETREQYVLHPSVLSASVQALIGFTLDELSVGAGDIAGGVSILATPSSLDGLRIMKSCPERVLVYVRLCSQQLATEELGKTQAFDIDVCDEQGQVCVRMFGFKSRQLKEIIAEQNPQLALLERAWVVAESHASAHLEPTDLSESETQQVVILDFNFREYAAELQERWVGTDVQVLDSFVEDKKQIVASLEKMYASVQKALRSKSERLVSMQIVIARDARNDGLLSAVSGLLKSATLENPKFVGQVIGLEADVTAEDMIYRLRADARSKKDQEIRYIDRRREVVSLRELSETSIKNRSIDGVTRPTLPWKDGGVYLITGGAGGLGLLVANEIAEKVQAAKIILIGRSAISEEKQVLIEALNHRDKNLQVEYRVVDVCDSDAVAFCVRQIVEKYGSLNGVLHCAGVIRDSFIIRKTLTEFREVLAPKVLGTINLDGAAENIELDFFIFFSSVVGAFGNAGQGDYATANAFLDCYTAYRNELVSQGKRRGRTLSINWPLWAAGGMQVDEPTMTGIRRLGFDLLSSPAGFEALYRSWASEKPQVIVLAGKQSAVTALLGSSVGKSLAARKGVVDLNVDSASLKERTLHRLKKLVGDATKFSVNQIDAHETFESYGVDSIMIARLNQNLAEIFGELPKTLFYEYLTLNALCIYLIESHWQSCVHWCGMQRQNHSSSERENTVRQASAELTSVTLPAKRHTRFDLKASMNAYEYPSIGDGIAIIGVSGHYPQARNLAEYWGNLKAGKDCVVELPVDRWNLEGFFCEEFEKALMQGKSYSKWGGFIEGFAEFDPLFFNISPREAINMDPQERLFLQSCWHVVEDAGYTKESLAKRFGGRVGVYVGVTNTGFSLNGPELWAQGSKAFPRTSFSSIANRVSYLLDLHGPSIPIDTMCSASLSAIHEACEHLIRKECDLAIAGGVNIYLHPSSYVGLCAQRMLSRDGRCKSFGAGGNGFVPGEGVGAVLLKPLKQAIEDHDHIYAVIKGTSINHGGKTNGYTVPNPNSQRDLIESALKKANIDARAISYIEAHGTGTELGDPIEVAGLSQAFARYTDDKQFCALGSVKSNIGHLEAAAGIAGLTKIVLQMRHRTLVPSLHAESQNPNIDFTQTPFALQRELGEWKRPILVVDGQAKECARTAGISSFGAGGANAHIIIEEYCESKLEATSPLMTSEHPALVLLSAKNEARLLDQAKQLLGHIDFHSYTDADLGDIAYTLQTGREAMECRLALRVLTLAELQEKLRQYVAGDESIEAFYRGEMKNNKDALSIFTSDDELQEAIGKWMKRGKYAKLLEFWVKGGLVDWSMLHREGANASRGKPKRISLPTYPFSRERYWFLDAQGNQCSDGPGIDSKLNAGAAGNSNQEAEIDVYQLMTFEERWQEEVLTIAAAHDEKPLVVFLSDSRKQSQLRSIFAKPDAARPIIFVSSSEQYVRFSDIHHGVAEDIGDSYVEALEGIKRDYGCVGSVLYLWNIEDKNYVGNSRSIVYLIQALGKAQLDCDRMLIAAELSGSNKALDRCYMESWIGFERSLKMVLPKIQVAVIARECATDAGAEIGVAASGDKAWQTWLQHLPMEFAAVKVESALYVGERRHVLRVQPQELANGTDVLRFGGTYLITGGAGGLGWLIAEHLAREYSANLILTGRSESNRSIEKRIAALEKNGSHILYICANVCDVERMRAGLLQAEERFGGIQGVIHAAGVEGTGSVLTNDITQFESVVAPKIAGTIALDHALAGINVEFVCYFSSSAAVLGDFGSCDYAIGNRFQSAYARYRNEQRRDGKKHGRTIAIKWPLWQSGGMGLPGSDAAHLYLKASGQRALSTHAGIESLIRLLKQDGDRYLVMNGQKNRVYRFLGMEQYSDQNKLSDKKKLHATAKAIKKPHSRVELKGLAVSQSVLWDLKELVSDILMLAREKMDVDENLAEFGFDSIGLAEFAKRLTHYYGFEVQPSVFFSHATLRKLSAHFLKEQHLILDEFYREDSDTEVSTAHSDGELATPDGQMSFNIQVEGQGAKLQPPEESAQLAEPIVIIGISGRFPGARNVDDLWQLLIDGKEVVREIPLERFDWREHYQGGRNDQGANALTPGKSNGKWLGVLPGVDEFDPLFFEISPREAELMDPRQRLLLQESFKALEDAGYGSTQLTRHKIGMFVGVEQGDYQWLAGGEGNITANHDAILAARLSYFLNLRGPAMAINTACSSGLVAAHQACQSLRSRECDTAIAAGVNLILTPQMYVGMSQAGMLSGDGKCYAFDRRANGMVPGEAVVAVVFKRLSQAEEDKDLIYAVVRGSGINYDGKTNGLTAPSGAAQTELIRDVYTRARIKPSEIEYIVTHGTGTRLGDPIEINALREAFKESEQTAPYCALTSTKTNLGHTFAASGLVSLVSLVQALRHETIPASLHCEQLSDYIDWRRSPFYVNTQNKAWPKRQGKARLGAVSAFGMSGTNAHMVVEGYDQEKQRSSIKLATPFFLLALSAKSDGALRQRARDLVGLLQNESQISCAESLAALSYTLLNHRQHFNHRCAVIVTDREQALALLNKVVEGEFHPAIIQGAVAHEFVEQEMLREYASDMLLQLSLQQESPTRYQQSLAALGDLYRQGYQLNWLMLSKNHPLQRIAVPTYPFLQEHYWIDGIHESPKGKSQVTAQVTQQDKAVDDTHFDSGFFNDIFADLTERNLSIEAALERISN